MLKPGSDREKSKNSPEETDDDDDDGLDDDVGKQVGCRSCRATLEATQLLSANVVAYFCFCFL